MKHSLLARSALLLFVPSAFGNDARSDYRDLRSEFNTASREFERQCKLIEEERGAAALLAYRAEADPIPEFAERAFERAIHYAGSEGAFDFLSWVVRNERGDPRKGYSVDAIEALVTYHAQQRETLSLLELLGNSRQVQEVGKERTVAVLGLMIERTGSRSLAQNARFQRGRVLLEAGTEAERKEARAALAKLQKEEAGTVLGERVAGWLFELDHLQFGSIAPDIEAEDLDGVPFKLSDYRGKVVVLDFWGDW